MYHRGSALSENVRLEDLGRAKKVIIDKDNTTMIEGAGNRLSKRAFESQDAIKTPVRLRPGKTAERFAAMAGGVAVIRVGAATETEMKRSRRALKTRCTQRRLHPRKGYRSWRRVAAADSNVVEKPSSRSKGIQTGAVIIRRTLEEPVHDRQECRIRWRDHSSRFEVRVRRRWDSMPMRVKWKISSRLA
jgi:chaperonin GroEL